MCTRSSARNLAGEVREFLTAQRQRPWVGFALSSFHVEGFLFFRADLIRGGLLVEPSQRILNGCACQRICEGDERETWPEVYLRLRQINSGCLIEATHELFAHCNLVKGHSASHVLKNNLCFSIRIESKWPKGLITFVHLQGTRDAAPRTVALTKWAQDQCKELFSQFDIDPNDANGLFYNGRYRPGTPGTQSSTSGVLAEILAVAGLKQIGLKALQLPFWRARSPFDSTGRLSDAAGVLGCSAIKALAQCGIDGDALYGVVSI